MVYTYSIRITHNPLTNETEYESEYKGNVLRYEIFFGKSPYIEILYFFSLRHIQPSLKIEQNDIHILETKCIFYSAYKEIENTLFRFLYDHKCEIV